MVFVDGLLLSLVATAVALDASHFGDPPPTPAPFLGSGLAFASAFSDHAVLQRAPAAAAVYGIIRVADGSGVIPSGVTVTIAPRTDSAGGPYTVVAEHFDRVNATYTRWKARLRPMEGGMGPHTISATCIGCSKQQADARFSATIQDVVFGEIWFCSGQSNMWLPVRLLELQFTAC